MLLSWQFAGEANVNRLEMSLINETITTGLDSLHKRLFSVLSEVMINTTAVRELSTNH